MNLNEIPVKFPYTRELDHRIRILAIKAMIMRDRKKAGRDTIVIMADLLFDLGYLHGIMMERYLNYKCDMKEGNRDNTVWNAAMRASEYVGNRSRA